MQSHLFVDSVVGPIDVTHWGQVLMNPIAHGVVEVEAHQAQEVGIRTLTNLAKQIEESNDEVRDVVATVSRQSFEDGVKTVILFIPLGNTVHIALYGNGTVFLRRGERLAKLLDRTGVIFGEVQPGDLVLLTSRSFLNHLREEQIKHVLEGTDSSGIAEQLTLLLHETAPSVGATACVIQIPHLHEEKSIPIPLRQKRTISHVFSSILTVVSSMHWSGFAALIFSRRARIAALVTIVLLFFSTSIVLGIQKQLSNTQAYVVNQKIGEAKSVMEEGIALLDLNPLKARQRLTHAKELLEPLIKTTSARSREGRELFAVYRTAMDTLTQAQHQVLVTPTVFFDVDFLKKGSRIDLMASDGDKLVLADRLGVMYQLDVASKNGQIVAGGSHVAQGIGIAKHGDTIYLITKEGIVKIPRSGNVQSSGIIAASRDWGSIGSFVAFGGNLYLLDIGKSRIWKYLSTDSTGDRFGELHEYLNPDSFPDLRHANSMAIDGSIWIGTDEGNIIRLEGGHEVTFAVEGVDPGFGGGVMVYTNDTLRDVYVLDRRDHRVVVVSKNGEYQAQYRWQESLEPTALIVSETQRKILLLAEGKLYSIDLK